VSAPLTERPAQRALLERFVRQRPSALALDAEAGLLLDVAAGKVLALDWTRVAALSEERDVDSGRPYLLLALGDGGSLALADQGLAFAPSTVSSGPVPGLPAAVCLRDLQAAEARLTHFLRDHPGEAPERGHVDTFMFCLAVLEGARRVGFDVGPEERRLERILAELEARRRG
jgi:ribosomal protein S18 acetylase RimI-like enzyme